MKSVRCLSELHTAHLSRKWHRILAPLSYEMTEDDGKVWHYIVPAGYETDLASVPRVPFLFWLFGGRGPKSAVLHDHLLENGSDWAYANEAFGLCLTTEEPKAHSWAMKFGVDVYSLFA